MDGIIPVSRRALWYRLREDLHIALAFLRLNCDPDQIPLSLGWAALIPGEGMIHPRVPILKFNSSFPPHLHECLER